MVCCRRGGGAHTQRSIHKTCQVGGQRSQRRGRGAEPWHGGELSGCTMLGPKLLLILICTSLVVLSALPVLVSCYQFLLLLLSFRATYL